MQNENYIMIQGWMRNELNLKGNDLLVFAIIYGFSQLEGHRFNGNLQYLADWCGATKQGIAKNLKNLIDRGLIEKVQVQKDNSKCFEYGVKLSFTGYETKFHGGMKLSFTNNNIYNNKKEILSKDSITTTAPKPLVQKRNLYDSCLGVINNFTDNEELRGLLTNYLKFRLELARTEQGKPLYLNMWKGLVNKLLGYTVQQQIRMVSKSLELGYLSFYEPNNNRTGKKTFDPDDGSCQQDTEADRQDRQSFIREMQKQGKRTEF